MNAATTHHYLHHWRGDPNPAGDIRYLDATRWDNYLLYVKTIRQSLHLPAVLWQIPLGHLNSTQTASPTYWNTSGDGRVWRRSCSARGPGLTACRRWLGRISPRRVTSPTGCSPT